MKTICKFNFFFKNYILRESDSVRKTEMKRDRHCLLYDDSDHWCAQWNSRWRNCLSRSSSLLQSDDLTQLQSIWDMNSSVFNQWSLLWRSYSENGGSHTLDRYLRYNIIYVLSVWPHCLCVRTASSVIGKQIDTCGIEWSYVCKNSM